MSVGDHRVAQWWKGVMGQQHSCKVLIRPCISCTPISNYYVLPYWFSSQLYMCTVYCQKFKAYWTTERNVHTVCTCSFTSTWHPNNFIYWGKQIVCIVLICTLLVGCTFVGWNTSCADTHTSIELTTVWLLFHVILKPRQIWRQDRWAWYGWSFWQIKTYCSTLIPHQNYICIYSGVSLVQTSLVWNSG